jgi:protein-S-isoprenylcysteine O-methyltransferase Ste14
MEEPVPLSEHEQRLLEQIEQALYAEDPKFAQSWRVRDLRSLQRARVLRAVMLVLLGLGLLVAGVIVQSGNTVLGVALGVGGFLLMLAGAWLAMSRRQRTGAAAAPAKARAPRPAAQPKQSLKTRLEERWQRRQDEGR